MMKIAKVMVVLATLAVYRSRAVIHTLKYFYYRSSGVPNFPEFSGAALLDGAEILHYDSDTRRAEPRQEWMENLSAGDPQYWERETAKFLGAQQSYKARIEILKPRFNQTGEIPSITSNTTAIVGVAVAVAVLVLGTIAGFIVYRQKKGKCPRAEGHPEVMEPLRSISA